MVKIPRSQPGGTIISREVPVRTIQQSQFDTGDVISGAGKAIGEYSDMLQKAFIVAEKTKAQNIFNSRIAEINEKAAAEPNFDTATRTKYYNELEKARQEASSAISLQEVKNNFLTEAEGDALTARIKLDHGFTKKAIDSGKADWIVYDNDAKDAYISAISPEQRKNIILKHDQKLEEMVAGGFLSREESAKERAERASKWTVAQVERDIQINPQQALAELQKGKQGAYAELPEEKRTDLIKSADNYSEKLTRQEKEAIAIAENKRESELIDMKINNALTETQVKEEREAGRISAKFADSMISSLRSPKTVGAKTKDSTFNKLADFILNPDNKPEDMRLELLRENAKGTINDEDFNILYIFSQQMKGDKSLALPKGLNFWHTDYANNNPEVRARMFKNYIRRIAKNEEPALAIDAVIKDEAAILHPQATTYPKEGSIIMDVLGRLKRIFPTFEIKDEQETGDAD